MKYGLSMSFATAGVLLLVAGCRTPLPVSEQVTRSQWETFDSARKAFEQVVPGKTTCDDLRGMGFDPETTPNLRILNYLELLNQFMPNAAVTFDDLPPEVRAALEARERCRAYELDLTRTHREREGNLLLDVFGFRRSTRETGWNFKGLLVILDDAVVYKLSSGQPSRERFELDRRPLGPLQEIDASIALPTPW
ncbi:MAG TPA: hypothetical protein DCY13_15260 [Verrucomicrobiales bacterium]|nr:hypothetical protein [Verrucomicrobiales bacterium]